MIDNIFYTCSVSGHREVKKDLDETVLRNIFTKLIKNGKINTFLIGMAIGFDTICFKILEEIRKTEKIKIVAVIPCKNQDYNFNVQQKLEYDRMLSSADEKFLVSEEYKKGCMQKRNRYLVDNSSVLVAYVRKEKGGAVYTKNYALKKGVPIIEV